MSTIDFEPQDQQFAEFSHQTSPIDVMSGVAAAPRRFGLMLTALRENRAARRHRMVFQDRRVHEDYRASEARQQMTQESVLRAWGQARRS